MLTESDLQTRKKELEQLIGTWAEEKKILLPGETIEIEVRIVSPPKVRIEIVPAANVDGAVALIATLFGSRTDQIKYESLVDLESALQRVLSSLEEREAKILIAKFGLSHAAPLRRKEMIDMFGISGSRIRQIEMKAFRKMRHPTRLRFLQEFMRIEQD